MFFRRSLLTLACALLLGAAAGHADEDGVFQARTQLTILQLNDVYSVLPVDGGKAGGLARVAALKKQIAAAGKPVLLVLAGDFLSPSVESTVFKGEQMVAGLNAAGLDIATLGNHEFDFGPDVLRQRMREAKWQWVVSNVIDTETKKPVGGAAPYLIREYGPLKVGFIGVVLRGEELVPDRIRGLEILDPIRTAKRLVPLLKQQGANVIVAITHLDFDQDRALAEQVPEIDVIVGGHEHFPITTMVRRTLISKAGSDARYVARIDLVRESRKAPLERHFDLIPITDQIPDEPQTARVAAEYEARLGRELEVPVATTRTPLDGRESTVRERESNLGNLLADAMRASAGADVAVLNGGSIRGNQVFPAGRITRRNLVTMQPFGGVVTKVEITGAALLAGLNHGVSRLGQGDGRFPQVSGVSFAVNPTAPVGTRVRDVRVGGQPLDPQKTYTVAINDYALEGGDGYTMFGQGRVLVDAEHGDLILGVVEAYLREKGEVSPTVEGRIRMDAAMGTIRRRHWAPSRRVPAQQLWVRRA